MSPLDESALLESISEDLARTADAQALAALVAHRADIRSRYEGTANSVEGNLPKDIDKAIANLAGFLIRDAIARGPK